MSAWCANTRSAPIWTPYWSGPERLGVLLHTDVAHRLAGPDGVRLNALTGLDSGSFPRSGSPAWYDEIVAILRSHGLDLGGPARRSGVRSPRSSWPVSPPVTRSPSPRRTGRSRCRLGPPGSRWSATRWSAAPGWCGRRTRNAATSPRSSRRSKEIRNDHTRAATAVAAPAGSRRPRAQIGAARSNPDRPARGHDCRGRQHRELDQLRRSTRRWSREPFDAALRLPLYPRGYSCGWRSRDRAGMCRLRAAMMAAPGWRAPGSRPHVQVRKRKKYRLWYRRPTMRTTTTVSSTRFPDRDLACDSVGGQQRAEFGERGAQAFGVGALFALGDPHPERDPEDRDPALGGERRRGGVDAVGL